MDFTELKQYLDRCDRNFIPCSRTVIMRDHEIVFDYVSTDDPVLRAECESRPLYYLFSASKVVTCTAVMRLIEENKLSPEDPVAKYLPEFAHPVVKKGDATVPAQNTLRIRHLLSMTSGFSYELGHPAIKAMCEKTHNTATTRQIAEAIAQMPLYFEPGEKFMYGLSHDVLAAIVEVVTGKRFSDYLHEIIFDPLEMTDFTFTATDEVFRRMNRQYMIPYELINAHEQKPICPYKISGNHESGGAGMIGSARQYARLLDSLACASDGKGVLKRETVDAFRRPMLSDEAQASFAVNPNRVGYSYACGVRTLVDPAAAHTLAPVGEFGWDGAAGAYALIDPEHHLSLFYIQHVLNCGYVFAFVHPSIRNLVYQALDREGKNV